MVCITPVKWRVERILTMIKWFWCTLEIYRHCDSSGAFPSMQGKPFKDGRTPLMWPSLLSVRTMRTVCVWNRETQSLSSTVSSLCTPPSRLLTSFIFSSFLSWVNSPSLSCFPVSSPHPSLFLSLHHLNFSYFRCFYRMYTAVPPPLSALHAFTLPPYTQCPSPTILPLYPHKNGYNSRGTFIKSKNKHVSVSVLLPWHVPQGCAALWMALSVRLVWGSVHTLATHTTEQHTHTL